MYFWSTCHEEAGQKKKKKPRAVTRKTCSAQKKEHEARVLLKKVPLRRPFFKGMGNSELLLFLFSFFFFFLKPGAEASLAAKKKGGRRFVFDLHSLKKGPNLSFDGNDDEKLKNKTKQKNREGKTTETKTVSPSLFLLFLSFFLSSIFCSLQACPLILSISTSNTSVAPPGILGGEPIAPYPRSDGILSLRFSPTHIAFRPWSQPLMTCPAPRVNSKGSPLRGEIWESF